MTNLDSRYEAWKNRLLDLGKRNRLLNFKNTARSTVMITCPQCDELYNMFVKEENTLIFPCEEDVNAPAERVYHANVQTDKSMTDLPKTLRNLRSKAKTAIEEQGVNVLYLAFGFLRWAQPEEPGQFFDAPLILVPVSLTVESIASPYFLRLHEDEIVLNPTLAYKLEKDYGIRLPDFDETGDINAFFDAVRAVIAGTNWSVSESVGLSLLSFLKINMYADLCRHKDGVLSNSIVRAVSGDISAASELPDGLADYDFDKNEKPSDVFQIVDADASQQDAILMAKKGVSFVLQGPPGTGKSQTITNIIAQSLAEGKKVLFVSEKMAALDVVHRRLADAGLDDFCLVLHSHKANKRSVMDQLGRVLALSGKKVSLSDEAERKLETLQADKEKLNDYARQICETVEPLSKSIYEVNGMIANLEEYEDHIFSVDGVRQVSKEQYHRFCYLLSQLAATIGKMTDGLHDNPWRDCTLTSVSNEFRHDVSYRLHALLPKIRQFDETLPQVSKALVTEIPHTVKDVKGMIAVLDCAQSAYEIPPEWILTEELQPLIEETQSLIELKKQIFALCDKLTQEYALIRSDEPSAELCEVDFSDGTQVLREEREKLISFILSAYPYSVWNEKETDAVIDCLTNAVATAKTVKAKKEELLEEYDPGIFEMDYKAVLGRIKTEYTSFTKIFKKEYKQDKKFIQLHHKQIVRKISDEQMLSVVEKLREIDEAGQWFRENADILYEYFGVPVDENTDFSVLIRQLRVFGVINDAVSLMDQLLTIFTDMQAKDEALQQRYRFLYQGVLSDWEGILDALNWAVSFRAHIAETSVSEDFVKEVCKKSDFLDVCRRQKEILKDCMENISFEYNWFVSHFARPEVFDSTPLTKLFDRLDACVNGLFLLEEWIDFSRTKSDCVEAGLADYIRIIEANDIPAETILPVFQKRFFRLWLDAVHPEYPAVLHFRRKKQEDTIREFASLDKLQFEIAKARIRSRLINNLPSLEHFTSGVDEISILKRELNKRRRIMPIRRLFKAIPNLLLTLKPCLMMSPLSVSLFLEAETYQFDLVIFDEASQVCTENAIGAISRAKQVIIAGDSKQLPPTDFFRVTVSEKAFEPDEQEDEFDDPNAYESILDEAGMLPERTLRWHYRSRHESLIAFSNAKIYDNKLITFPSNTEKTADNGVEYIYVADGFYDRGGKKGNVVEAERVADLVFEHFRQQPHRSLGVIAFGEVQQQAIETVLRKRRMENRGYEAFFAEDKPEAFFVKNLENVQGDERDTIIFSIGYAKDAEGVFRMNFGPLSKTGGERRLNVAVTRAKYNVKLVGSFMPTDINVDKISAQGPKLLRSYIEFAINGYETLERAAVEKQKAEYELPFEEAVCRFLEKAGYQTVTQVGCSEYRIDIAVKHPALEGVYVLGIECDGASYHSARTARERDRLRQEVLENMGWKIYRMWSADWIKDPETEGRRLTEAIDAAIAGYGDGESPSEQNLPKAPSDSVQASDFVTVEEKDLTLPPDDNLYGFEKAETTDFSVLPRSESGYLTLTDCIMAVVDTEYPVHYDLLCQRLAPLFGNEKTTVKIRREVDFGLAALADRIIRKGDFLFPTGYDTVPVRMPNSRKIQYISTEELAEAMLTIVKTCVGTTRAALCAETARVYGFTRTGPNISSAMSAAVDMLLEEGRVEEVEGKLKEK